MHLGVMLTVHARPFLLYPIFRQISAFRAKTHLQVTLSRPTAAVIEQVQRFLDCPISKNVTVELIEAPFNPLAPGKERFMELRQWQLERLPAACNYAVIWDDDHVLEDPDEVLDAMRDKMDLTYIRKVFFWDNPTTISTAFPEHNSCFVFRRLPGDKFDMDRVLHAPATIHDTAKKVIQLQGRLLDYGYMHADDRARCWDDYKRVGKIDPATRPLVEAPRLAPWPGKNYLE